MRARRVGVPLFAVCVMIAAFTVPRWGVNGYVIGTLTTVAMYSVAALGARLLLLGGMWSFGQGAALTVGAYTTGLLMTKEGVPFWLTVAAAAAVAALAAGIMAYPALRVRGVYFAILTMTFGFAVSEAIIDTPSFSNGAAGVVQIGGPGSIPLPGGREIRFGSPNSYYYLIVAMLILAFLLMVLIDRSHMRPVLDAVRQNEVLAEALGIRAVRYKAVAFVLVAAMTATVGSFSAAYYSTANSTVWSLWPSVYIIVYAIVGGIRSPLGPIVGAGAVTLAVQLFQQYQSFELIFTGASLILVTFLLPGGIETLWKLPWRRSLIGDGRVRVTTWRTERGASPRPQAPGAKRDADASRSIEDAGS